MARHGNRIKPFDMSSHSSQSPFLQRKPFSQREQARHEDQHTARMAEAERERADSEVAYLERLRQRKVKQAATMADAERERVEADTEVCAEWQLGTKAKPSCLRRGSLVID